DAQCSAKEECVESACVPLAPCKSSLDCANGGDGKTICDKSKGVCVQCTASADCGDTRYAPTASVTPRASRTAIAVDPPAVQQGLHLHQPVHHVRGVLRLRRRQALRSGECVPFTCTPSHESCAQNNVVQCNDTGSDGIPQMQCLLSLLAPICMVDGDNAK